MADADGSTTRPATLLGVEPAWQHRLLVTVNHWIARAPLTEDE